MHATWIRFLRLLPPLLGLSLLLGCAGAQGLPGVFLLVLLLALFSACRPMLDNDTLDEFLLRKILRDSSSSSSSSTAACTATQDYTRSFDLSAVDPATAGIGFTITGEVSGDKFGISVGGAGDFNGDGINDIIVSASNHDTGGANAGRVYVLFGRSGSGGDIDTASLTTSTGITIDGPSASAEIGWNDTARGAGDFNGDGFDDIIFSTYRPGGYNGYSYLILGSASPANIAAIGSITTAEGARYYGPTTAWWSGYGIGATGDVNGDGLDDFVIASYYGPSNNGEAHIIYGKSTPTASAVDLSTISGTTGFEVIGNSTYMYSVAGAGDLNGDGLNEILLGSHDGARTYVIYGESGTSRTTLNTSSLAASDGFTITAGSYNLGQSTSGGGDFNGDGRDDFVSSHDGYGTNKGATMLFYGNVGDLTVGSHSASQGSLLLGDTTNMQSGSSASLQGDVNGDGLTDLLVGARGADYSTSNSGSAFLIFGQSGIAANTTLSTFNDGTNGIRVDGPATSGGNLGWSVALSDVNGDGCADMIMGAPNTGTGTAYVIFGGTAE